MFFFEKKNQKTFVPLRALPARRAPTGKRFLLLFFKKEDLLSPQSSTLPPRVIPELPPQNLQIKTRRRHALRYREIHAPADIDQDMIL
jgi:hypothetical protein